MYEMLTGPFIGEIVEEAHTYIIGLDFDQLDDDMQSRVADYATLHNISDMQDAIERYENSWESIEVE